MLETIVFREEFVQSGQDLVRLKPYGIIIGSDRIRPVLILKDETSAHTLPVPISPIEAGVTMSQNNQAAPPTTPHRVTEYILQTLGVVITRCVFTEVRGHHLYVNLEFSHNPALRDLQLGVVKLRAEEAMSLCLQLHVPIYASPELMSKTRVLQMEMLEVARLPHSKEKNQNFLL